MRELGIGFVPHSPLGRGLLTGTITDLSKLSSKKDARLKRYPRFAPQNFEQNRLLVERVGSIADRKQVMPGQLAFAWVLAMGEDMAPIPGTKHRTYLEQNADAVGIMLIKDVIAEIESTEPLDAVAGDRHTDVIIKDTRELRPGHINEM